MQQSHRPVNRKTPHKARPAFVPDFLLERIAEHGSPEQGSRAQRTLSKDAAFRSSRQESTMRTAAHTAENLLPPGVSGTAARSLQRRINDSGGTEELPGQLVRAEDDSPTDDAAVDEAYSGTGAVYDLFFDAYSRNSYDGAGSTTVASVHYGEEFANAFWNGTQLAFGDGDGELFNRFTIAVDIIAHEFTHGVVQYSPNLDYSGQSGALNEHLCDVFGVLTKQRTLSQDATEADWLVGKELFTEEVEGRALRSMAEPGTAFDDPVLGQDPQVAHTDDYVETEEDNGGVHINSGIPNKAFYEAATAFGGSAWGRAGRIWYAAMTDPELTREADFRLFAGVTVRAARRLFGEGSDEPAAVREAWSSVGLGEAIQ